MKTLGLKSKVDAAYLILKKSGRAIHARKIVDIALEKGLIETKGKTPFSTLAVDILLENRRREAQRRPLRFKKVGPSLWKAI